MPVSHQRHRHNRLYSYNLLWENREALKRAAPVTDMDLHYNTNYFGEHTMTMDQLVTACNSNAGKLIGLV